MSCNCSSDTEVLRMFHELKQDLSQVKNDCFRIRQEILGVTNDSHEFGLMENVTIRQVMERMAFDIETLKARTESGRERDTTQSTGEADEIPDNSEDPTTAETGVDGDATTEDYIVKDVTVKTLEEEKMLTISDLEQIKSARTLMDGSTLKGKTASGILASINTNVGFVVEINNYLDVSLSERKIYFHSNYGNLCSSSASMVPGGSREVISINHNSYIYTLFSFRIGRSNKSLVVSAGLNPNADLRLAFAPAENLNKSETWNFYNQLRKGTVSDFREDIGLCALDGKGEELWIKSGNLRARAKLQPGPKSILTLDIGSVEGIECMSVVKVDPPKFNDNSLATFSRNQSQTLLSAVTEEYAALLRICNVTKINLEDPFGFLLNGTFNKIPDVIKPATAECIIKTSTGKLEGVVTYRIKSTDLRLAIGFKVTPTENLLGIGFVPLETLTDQTLMNSLFVKNEWSWETRNDQKLAKASDAYVTIYRRNIIARAKMSTDKRAMLQV